jgi:succinate-semialdehyde dehydrogenase/glutarate-semialdehyde dehydrogenase
MTSSFVVRDPLALVGDEWRPARAGACFDVTDPATGDVIASAPDMDGGDTADAIEAAESAFRGWARRPVQERSQLLRAWASLMIEERDYLADLVVREQGKPLREAVEEVTYAASFLDWFAEEARRADGAVIPGALPGRRTYTFHQPFGVGACITPWNFPVAMITRKAAPALAAGNTVVLKPAEQTPLSALALAGLATRAGIPGGVVNVVTGSAESAPLIGRELTTHRSVRKVSFTGSTAVGAMLMAQAASTIKDVSLELGGNAPFLVFADADLSAAVEGLIAAKYRNAGQTCISANRVLVERPVYREFQDLVSERVAALHVGHGLDPVVDIGPLIDDAAMGKAMRHIDDAVARGARVLSGGRRHALGGNFLEPTLLTDCPQDGLISCEETFGPVAALSPFDDEAQAVAHSNDTDFGLAAYVYTTNADRVWRVSEELETGMVAVNTAAFSSPAIPFGGVKQSGRGREGGHDGLADWLETKYVCQAVAER